MRVCNVGWNRSSSLFEIGLDGTVDELAQVVPPAADTDYGHSRERSFHKKTELQHTFPKIRICL